MKKYYSARELTAKGIDLSELVHSLVHDQTEKLYAEAYVRLTHNENQRLIRNLAHGDAFVRLPKKILQLMEMNLHKGEYSTNIMLSHFIFKVDEGLWYRYVDLYDDDLLREQITDEKVKNFSEGAIGRIAVSPPLTLEHEFILSRQTMTIFDCDIRDIYLKSSSTVLRLYLRLLQASTTQDNLNLLLQDEDRLLERQKVFFQIQKALLMNEHSGVSPFKKRIFSILRDLGYELSGPESRPVQHFAYIFGSGSIRDSER